MANTKRKQGALPTRYSSKARLRWYAVLKVSGTHDNKQARNTTLPNHLGDPMIPMIAFMDLMSVFQIDGWSPWRAAIAKLILGDSSPQSAADSTTYLKE